MEERKTRVCGCCGDEHSGEHLDEIGERADAHGMESLTEHEQYILSEDLCEACVVELDDDIDYKDAIDEELLASKGGFE